MVVTPPVTHGSAAVVSGVAPANTTIEVYARHPDELVPFHVAWVKTDADGRWRVVVRPDRTTQYAERGGGQTLGWVTLRVQGVLLVAARGRNATIRLLPRPRVAGLPVRVGPYEVETDARGIAVVRGLRPGRWTAQVWLGAPFGHLARGFEIRR
jgi:hypothetical protein